MMKNPFKRKKKVKLSDEVVAIKWGKKPKMFVATDKRVKFLGDFNPPERQEFLGEEPKVDFEKLFEVETGKNAVWGGKVTKQFLVWKEKYVMS